MFHLKIRRFPKQIFRYNLAGPEIGRILIPWVKDEIVELGEQEWSPRDCEITVFEGPEVPAHETTMGRGWSAVQRKGREVTEQVLAEASQAVAGREDGGAATVAAPSRLRDGGGASAPASPSTVGAEVALAMQLGALLGPEAPVLLETWKELRAGDPALSPSEALARAEERLAGRA